MSAEDQQRVSDADREAVAGRLRDAAAEGRLDPAELDERLTVAYGARTRADLAPLTGDLPVPAPAPPPGPSLWRNEDVRDRLGLFIVANVVSLAVWAVTGADGSFWPKWVLLGTGIALVAAVVYGVLGIEHEDDQHRPRRLPGPPPPPPPGG